MQLWRHPNGNWYVLHGQRLKKRISAGTKDRRQAEIFLSQFIAGSQEPTLNAPTVETILDGYGADHGKSLRGKDGLRYGTAALIRQIGNLKPDQVTPTVIKRYAAERGAAPGTILRELGILRAALKWARSHNLIAYKPDIPNPVQPAPARSRWLTKDEARMLLANCTEPHVRLFITLGLMTAARSGAILDLKWDQVDLKRQTIDYGRGHGNKRRAVVKLNPEAVTALEAAKSFSCSDYVVEFRGKPVRFIKNGFAAACRRAKIKGVTPHILRHSAATWAAIEGRPLQEIARMLGDSVATVEAVYAKWTPDYLTETVGALQLGPARPKSALQVKGKPRKTGHKRATNRES